MYESPTDCYWPHGRRLVEFGATDAVAWGNEGHRIVCQIALERLTTQGQALMTAIQADLSSVEDPFRDCPDPARKSTKTTAA
jgi:uncharacterized protein YebE (UPF0316 family)